MAVNVLLEESVSDALVPIARRSRETRPGLARALREPLVHFLLLGLVLYAAAGFFGKTAGRAGSNRIEVTQAEIRQMQSTWQTQWGRAPTDSELHDLIDQSIREEILYREALAAGLDRDDSIIRRRLVQKMQFLMQDPSLIGEPTDAQLLDWFHQHSARYAEPPAFDFTHVYFSRSEPGASNAASRALTSLQANRTTPAHLGDVGEAFITGNEFHDMTSAKASEQFGSAFAQALNQAPVEKWVGPLSSPYGFHLVWVERKVPGSLPPFASVRSQVLTDFMTEQMRTAERRAYSTLLRHYVVRIENGGKSQ